jgi:hypothetical protein
MGRTVLAPASVGRIRPRLHARNLGYCDQDGAEYREHIGTDRGVVTTRRPATKEVFMPASATREAMTGAAVPSFEGDSVGA